VKFSFKTSREHPAPCRAGLVTRHYHRHGALFTLELPITVSSLMIDMQSDPPPGG
jgi:hypothetical protein